MPRFLLLLLVACITSVAHAAEVVTLSAENFDEYAPRGKEADAIIGDYVLRNDKIVAAIADPTLLSGRSAQRWAIQNVAGALLDLTTRDNQNDQLTVYYPGPYRYKPDAPGFAPEFVDEREAHKQPGREPRQGKRVSVTVPAYEMHSGKLMVELEKLPAHLRPALKTTIEVTYTLEDGWDYLQVDIAYHNPSKKPEPLKLFAALRIDGEVETGFIAADGGLTWAYNPWWNQAYGVTPVGHTMTAKGNRGMQQIFNASEPAVTLKPGETYTVTRRIFPARDQAGVRAIAARLAGQTLTQHTIPLTAPDGPVADAPVEIMLGNSNSLWATTRSDAKGMVHLALPSGHYTAVSTPYGRTRQTTSIYAGEAADIVDTDGAPPKLEFERAAHALITVTDAAGAAIPAKIAFRGIGGTKTPDFFPTSGDVAVRNLRYTADGRCDQILPPGRYEVLITYGPEYSIARQQIEVKPGEDVAITATLERQVDTTGWISAETHNHSTLSFFEEIFFVYPYRKDPSVNGDSVASTRGRVLNLLAEQVEFAVSTEHNWIADYGPIVAELGASSRMKTVPGIGLTAGRRHAVDHQNAWPMIPIRGKQDGGAIQRPEHVPQLGFMAEWYDESEKLIQTVDLKAAKSTVVMKDMDMLDVVDLLPIVDGKPLAGRDNRILEWLDVLRHGYRLPGVANEGRYDNFHGSGGLRNYVASPTDDPAAIDPMDVLHAMEAGNVIMTTGPFMTVALSMGEQTAKPGDDITGSEGTLHVTLQATGGIVMDRVQVLLDGRPITDMRRGKAAFGDGVAQFSAEIPVKLAADGFLIVVASGTGPNLRDGDAETVTHVAVANPIWVDTTGDGYSPHSPLHDAVATALTFVEAPMTHPGAPPGRVRLRLTNTGEAPARDTVELFIRPAHAGIVIGENPVAYHLPYRGAQDYVEWEISFTDSFLKENFPIRSTYNNRATFGIATERSGTFPGRRPADLWMQVDNAVMSLPPMDDLAAVSEALKPALVYPVTPRGKATIGNVRFGVSGDSLVLEARVKDKRLEASTIPWEGSCVEIFGAMPGRNPANTVKPGGYYSIQQVYLVPAVGDAPATAYKRLSENDPTILPAPEIAVTSQTTDDGYVITAKVPLEAVGVKIDYIERYVYKMNNYVPVELLNLVPTSGRFILDARFNTHMTPTGITERHTIFGSNAPHMDHSSFGRMRLIGDVRSQLDVVEHLPATPGEAPGKVRLTLTNTADHAIKDSVTLVLDPPGIATIRGDATVTVALEPGATMTREFEVELLQKTMASGVYVSVPKSPMGHVVRVPSPLLPIANRPLPYLPATDLAGVTTALKDLQPYPITIDDKQVVDLRFAVAGDFLILDATVTDAKLLQGARPWKGSLVEIFAAAPEHADEIHQIFLQPADAENPARALVPDGATQSPAPQVAIQSTPTATGYRLQAMVPVTMLGMEAAVGQIKLEFQVSTTLTDKVRYGTVFQSKRAYQDHSYYGRFEIKRDE